MVDQAIRILYVCNGYGHDETRWAGTVRAETSRPMVGDSVIFSDKDLFNQRQRAMIVDVARWSHPLKKFDYEVTIAVPDRQSTNKAAYEDWLTSHRFKPLSRKEFAEHIEMPWMAVSYALE